MSMPKCGVHFSKQKNSVHVKNSATHDRRKKENGESHTPKNADEKRSKFNEILMPIPDNRWTHVQGVIEKKVKRKVKPDAVKCLEAYCYTSPNFFKSGDQKKDQENLQLWKEKTFGWLKEEFGENLIEAHLHCDEKTPHVHASIIPIVDGHRLSAKVHNSRGNLQKFQTNYAESLCDLGIVRGKMSSGAKHVGSEEWYQEMLEAEKKMTKVEPARGVGVVTQKKYNEVVKKLEKAEKLSAHNVSTFRQNQNLMDKNSYLTKKNTEIEQKNFTLENSAAFFPYTLEREKNNVAEIYESKIQLLEEEKEELKEQYQKLANTLRPLDLSMVLRDYRKAFPDSEKVKKISIEDGLIYSDAQKIGKNAIDLVIELQQCPYREAVKSLAANYPERSEVVASVKNYAFEKAQEFLTQVPTWVEQAEDQKKLKKALSEEKKTEVAESTQNSKKELKGDPVASESPKNLDIMEAIDIMKNKKDEPAPEKPFVPDFSPR